MFYFLVTLSVCFLLIELSARFVDSKLGLIFFPIFPQPGVFTNLASPSSLCGKSRIFWDKFVSMLAYVCPVNNKVWAITSVDVFTCSNRLKVIWVKAFRVFAKVVQMQSFRYFPAFKCIREAMSTNGNPTPFRLIKAMGHPISRFGNVSVVNPTRIVSEHQFESNNFSLESIISHRNILTSSNTVVNLCIWGHTSNG